MPSGLTLGTAPIARDYIVLFVFIFYLSLPRIASYSAMFHVSWARVRVAKKNPKGGPWQYNPVSKYSFAHDSEELTTWYKFSLVFFNS